MRPLRASEIKGTWGTLLLPINADDSIDYGRLREEIAILAESGVNGIYSNGTAGEFHTQTEDEFDMVSLILASECERRRMPFQIGASHTSAQIALARVRRAVTLKPSAIQVILPDWAPPFIDDIVSFLERIAAEAAPVGLIVYNPPHAKRIITPEEWAIVADRVPGVVGMKVLGGDDAWYVAMAPVLKRLSVFVRGHGLASGVANGAVGAYSNVACLSPRGASRWYGQMQTDLKGAIELEQRIVGFFKAHISPLVPKYGFTNSALDKLLAATGCWGNVGTRLRWPYRWAPESEALRLREIARREMPEIMDA